MTCAGKFFLDLLGSKPCDTRQLRYLLECGAIERKRPKVTVKEGYQYWCYFFLVILSFLSSWWRRPTATSVTNSSFGSKSSGMRRCFCSRQLTTSTTTSGAFTTTKWGTRLSHFFQLLYRSSTLHLFWFIMRRETVCFALCLLFSFVLPLKLTKMLTTSTKTWPAYLL